MRRRGLFLLFCLSLGVRLVMAAFIRRPGYMDAAYYAAGAVHLAQGGGLSEPFLWNYLDRPTSVPRPGFPYWMPLPSLLAAPFAALVSDSFFALQSPFILLSALLPLVGYVLAWQATGMRRHAWFAGLLTLFSGFFFPYWTLPETFAPFALFGSLALWLASERGSGGAGERRGKGTHFASCILPLASGLLVGLAHLTRPDGVLLLPVVFLACLTQSQSRLTCHASRLTFHSARLVTCHLSFVILGYLAVMGPWFVRNIIITGAPLSPAGAKTLWLTTYDDIFCYGCDLSLRSYLAWGWGNILRSKLWAAGVNLERFLAEDCLIFLLPFVLIGFYRLRRHLTITLSLVYLLLVYLLHSLAFTFPGPRGGFFHASAPALPFLFAAGAEGLDAAVGWVGRRRRWIVWQSQAVFTVAAVVGAVALSAYVAAGKLASWQDADEAYREVGRWLDERNVPLNTTVMVGNPPAFWYHTHRPAIVVPNDDVGTLLTVVERYGVGYVVLDPNRPPSLVEPYPGLELAAIFMGGQVQLYQVRLP